MQEEKSALSAVVTVCAMIFFPARQELTPYQSPLLTVRPVLPIRCRQTRV